VHYRFSTILLTACCMLTGCQPSSPPDAAPSLNLPASFRTGSTTWKRTTAPKFDAETPWWRVFGDAELNALASQISTQNLTLQAAAARLEEARAISRSSRMALIPSLDFSPSGVRSEVRIPGMPTSVSNTQITLPIDLSYEVDMWGRLRKQIGAAEARSDAAYASLFASRLALTADAAQSYWSLRGLDADQALLIASVKLRKETLSLIESRFKAGTVSALDVSRAQTEVASAEAELVGLARNRSALVNALALVTGRAAGTISIPVRTELPAPPKIPAGIPSDLLLRRPDLRIAERNVAAANADVGASKAAFFPALRLRAGGGIDDANYADLLRAETLVFSIGYSITYPILGQRNLIAQKDAAVARHKVASAEYKQTVLLSLREAEDALQALDFLAQQESAQNKAVTAAQQSLDLSQERFSAGLISFLEVVETERTLLATKRLANNLRAQRLALSVSLIKALGGTW
jgi:multidrug efflux system outer membrane protein